MNAPTKVCKLCCSEFPATTEFFYAHSQTRDRLTPECKACKKKRAEDKRRVDGVGSRWHDLDEPVACTQCRLVCPWNNEFFVTSKGKVQQPCIQCNRKRAAEWQDANPERAAERKRIHAQKPEQRKQRGEWQRNNPDKQHLYYMKRRDRHIETSRAWSENNPERTKEIKKQSRSRHPETSRRATHKRLARKRGLPDTLTRQQWIDCLAFFGHRCAYCWKLRTPTYEHVIPYNSPDCPGNVAGNVIPACFPCNRSKSDTSLQKWLVKRFGQQLATDVLERLARYQAQLS